MKDAVQQADWEQAKAYVVWRLSTDLPPTLYYHNLAHTLDDVLPAAERLAVKVKLPAQETLLLRTAALYHDLGYLVRYRENEVIAAAIAAETLPQFSYTHEQIHTIQAMIMATHMPQAAQNQLEALLCDADLDSLGREDFFDTNRRLRMELMVHDKPVPQEAWIRAQLQFLAGHSYHTAAARTLRNTRKQQNIQVLEETLKSLQEGRTADSLILRHAVP
ncbi:MAG: HD domain-containing protein [Anaerolineae bacterium]|nr:HD domain-containing protein [Anaerolineae bacterium]